MPIDRVITSSTNCLSSTRLEYENNETKRIVKNLTKISNSPTVSTCSSNIMKNNLVTYKDSNGVTWVSQKKHGYEVIEDLNGRLDDHELSQKLSVEIAHLLKNKTHYKVASFNLYPSKKEQTARDFINENFEITPMTNHITRVEYSYTKNGVESYFLNGYEINRWDFMSNERDVKEKRFFFNQVIKEQVQHINMKLNRGFYLPSVIVREYISNEETIEKMEAFTLTADRYKGTTQEETEKNINEARLKHFMTETVNGKSTQRVLDDFHMEATHLDHRGKDFYIAVRPKRQGFADNLKDVSFAVNSGL